MSVPYKIQTVHLCVNFLIHGEDELTFANLLKELASDGCLEVIKVLPHQIMILKKVYPHPIVEWNV